MSSTTVVTQKYRCSRLCSLHKRGNILLPSSMGFSQQKEDIFEPISALPWTFFKPVKIFKESVIPRWGRVDFSNNPRFPHGGGHQVVWQKCSVNWPWRFSLAYAFGAPNALVIFWKKVVKNASVKNSALPIYDTVQKTRDLFFPSCFWFFFVNERIVVKRFFLNSVFFGPFFVVNFEGVAKHRGCSHCGLHCNRVLAGRTFLSWPVRMPHETVGFWDGN